MTNEMQDRWREITGVAGKPPPSVVDVFSGSSGDREKGKFRPSKYPRLYNIGVTNDDGSPVAEGVEELLVKLIDEIVELERRVDGVSTTLVETPNPIVFETAPIYPIGIGAASAYAILDAMGTEAVRVEVPKSGVIQGAIYYDRDDEGLGVNLWLFDDDVGNQTDNSAFALTDGDLMRVIDVIEFSSGFLDAANGQVLIGSGLNIPYRAPEGFIWCQVQAMGVLNIAAGSEPVFKLRILPDR